MSEPGLRLTGVVESTGYGVIPDPSLVGRITPGLPDVQRTLSWVRLASRYPVRIRIRHRPRKSFAWENPQSWLSADTNGSLEMATRAALLRHRPARWIFSWAGFGEFIRWELAPYPGRASTVVRMTIAATLVMFMIVTFRIPNAFVAGLFSVLLARENLAVTWRGGQLIVLGFALASLYTLLGMMLFRGFPITHFFWVIGSLNMIFFVIRTTTNYPAALAFAVPIGISLPIWDRTLSSEAQVEGTLWPIVVIAVAAGATLVTESLYRIFDRSDPLLTFGDDLLLAVQQWRKVLPVGMLHQKRSSTEFDNTRRSAQAG